MRAFSLPIDVTIDSRHLHRRIGAGLARDTAGGIDPSTIIIAIHDEEVLCRQALEARRSHSSAAVEPRSYREAELAAWSGWPMRLGRNPAEPDGSPLANQLAVLRAHLPDRHHFRIAIVGGFGHNLGDTLLGATAWRVAFSILSDGLPSFAADALLGPAAHPAIFGLLRGEPGFAEVSFKPPTLADFARYDAFFDFTDLLVLPRFFELPILDWILWWLGIDPAAIPNDCKRNRLRLPAPSRAWAGSALATVPGPRVAFVWRASTPLRSMTDDRAASFVRDLLKAAPEITLVVDRPIAVEHPRLVVVEAKTAFDMMALVASVDGLITVDSLAPHVADAADVPTVMILNSLPPSRFPFYPNMTIVTPPGAEQLPGWGVTKVAEVAWSAMAESYDHAWEGVSASCCWNLLAARIATRTPRRDQGLSETVPSVDESEASWSSIRMTFPHDHSAPLDRWVTDEMAKLASVVVGPGRTAVLAGGDNTLALRLARMVSREGEVHVLEPRRLRAQALAAEAQARGIRHLHLYPAIAGARSERRRIAAFDPASEADPAAWGNLPGSVEVAVMALDELRLGECEVIAIQRPQSWAETITGAMSLLANARPLLLAGPVIEAEHTELRTTLAAIGYLAGLSIPIGARAGDGAVLLGVPAEARARLEGFAPLQFGSHAERSSQMKSTQSKRRMVGRG